MPPQPTVRWLKRNHALKPIEAARQWIALNYDQPITIQRAAQIAGYSTSHFTKLFIDFYGESPRDFLANLRIKKALRLLATQSISVQEIAMEVGYTSFPTFSNRFKELTGSTPTEFKKSAKSHLTETGQPVNPVIPSCLSQTFQLPKNHKPE